MESRIRFLRERRGMSKEELAEIMGVTAKAIHRMEGNRSCIRIDMLVRMAKFFDVTTDFLLGLSIYEKEPDLDELEEDEPSYGLKEISDQNGDTERIVFVVEE